METPKSKKGLAAGMLALALAIGVVGGTMLQATQTDAQTTDTTTPTVVTAQSATTAPAPPPGQQMDQTKGGHVGANGTKEELLTGDTAEKVKSAALAALPSGTIERVETDAEGATYEAHMKKADGTMVTVKLDGSFKVTSTEDGMH